jgi:ribosome biogenesis GTPase / thiamine phosphate phosphatase
VNLERYGWTADWASAFEPFAAAGLEPGRVIIQHRGAYVLAVESGDRWSEMSGALRKTAASAIDRPAVGDWVAHDGDPDAERVQISALLPRRSAFIRNAAGEVTTEQVVAANVDVALLVSSLNQDLNPRRIERYLAVAWESGANPVIVLTKADLCPDVAAAVRAVDAVAAGVPIRVISAVTGEGIDELRDLVRGSGTAAAVGSSGVGKSTLINRLIDEERLATSEIRDDGRGRHTTTHRELVVLPGGGCIIDTPGMRVMQLWEADEGVAQTFDDIEELAAACRFRDCAHESEPGCAVLAAIAAGTLPAERLESYRKLQRELHFQSTRDDKRVRSEERRRWAATSKALKTDAY